MTDIYKIFLVVVFSLVTIFSYSQYEDEDLGFEKIKSKKVRLEKRKFNIHLEAGYSLSTVFGTQVDYLKDTLAVYQNRFNLDVYEVVPNYFPYGKINVSFNFSEKTSMTLGVKYSRLGWKELAKFNNSNIKFLYYTRYDFEYIAIPIAFHFHPKEFMSFNIGHTYSYLISNQVHTYEYDQRNGIVRTDKKTKQSFYDITGFRSSPFISQWFLGAELGTKRIRFTASFLFTGNFIRSNIYYNSFSLEAGILFKILNDYE